MINLNRHDFEDWLIRQDPDNKPCQKRGGCPLVAFLRSIGAERPIVGATSFTEDEYSTGRKLPSWAVRFVAEVDHDTCQPGWHNKTAGHLLDILRAVPQA